MKKDRGFTLIELMVVIALIAIVATLGFPGMQDLSANNKLMTNANDIVGSFHQARSEALRRSTTVTVQACKPGCGTTGAAAWTNGWRIWLDIDDDNTLDIDTDDSSAGIDSDGDSNVHELITEHIPLPAGMTVNAFGPGFVTSYSYNAQGRLDIDAADAFQLCIDNTEVSGRVIRINPIGRLSVEQEPCP